MTEPHTHHPEHHGEHHKVIIHKKPKHRKERASTYIVGFLVIAVIAGATIFGASRFAHKQLSAGATDQEHCQNLPVTDYTITIQDDQAMPDHFEAKECDNLTVVNFDDKGRLVAFGEHDSHMTYDGVSQKFLNKGDSFQVKLNKTGSFRLHDHNDDTIVTTFTVKPRD